MWSIPQFEFVDGKLVPSNHEHRTFCKPIVLRKPIHVRAEIVEIPVISAYRYEVWECHTIVRTFRVDYLLDPLGREFVTVPICGVYLPRGTEPDELVLSAVERWRATRIQTRK